MGAEKAVLVSDPALAGADALTTAKVLAGAVGKAGDYDLIIAGTESSDGYTGTVPEQMAEVLGLPSVGFAKTIAVDGRTSRSIVKPKRLRRGQLLAPCRGLGHRWSRRAALPELSRASWLQESSRSRPSLPPTSASSRSSWAQSISSVEDAPAREAGEIIEDDGETFNKIVEFLDNLKVI